MRIDLHCHVGRVYGSDKAVEVPVPVEDVKEYFYEQEITHALVCYTERSELETLLQICPDTKIYPIQWVDHTTLIFHTDINRGIKLHAYRGQKDIFNKTITTDYTSKDCLNILSSLPSNHIVQYHLQCSTSLYNTARAQTIMMLAIKFPQLKHMLIHGGAFGLKTMYPTANSKYHDQFLHLAVSAEMLIREAQLVADKLSNCFMDSSILLNSKSHFKLKYVCECLKSGLGSDYPFCINKKQASIGFGIKNQERIIGEVYGQEKVDEIHQRSLLWLESKIN